MMQLRLPDMTIGLCDRGVNGTSTFVVFNPTSGGAANVAGGAQLDQQSARRKHAAAPNGRGTSRL